MLDANGSPLSGIAAGRLGVVASPSTGVTLTQPTSATDAQGQTTVSAVVSTAGMVTFSATIDGGALGQTAQVTFSASAPDPARCSLAASKTSALADGSDAVTFTATIVDANGTALSDLAGTRLALAVDIASGVTWGSFGATDANGRAAATVTSTRSGSRSFQLWLDGQPAGAPVSVSFVAGPVAAATSTLTANKATAVANGQDSIILTLTLRDAQGNAKPGVAASAVSFTSTGGAGSGLTLTPPSVVSDASGRMTLSAKATVPQSVTLQVAIGSATWSQSVAFTAQQPSPSRSTVSLSPAVIAADGAEQATLSVRLVDVNGLAVVGSPASARSVASSVVSVTVADAGAESDAGGQFAMKLTARTAGTTQVTLTVAGVRLAPVTLTVSGYADLSLAAGLQFVGLPLTPRADAWTALTGVTGVDARAWDAASQTYVLPGMSYTPGTGLWVASDGARAQRVLGQATANAVQRLPLRRGWNALANPFGGAVSWDLANIGVEVSGAVVGNLADTSLWTTRVAPYGWLYSADGGYRLLGDRSVPEFASATGALPAMAGFWLHAGTDGVTLLLPPPGLARAGRAQVAPTAADWTLALTARQDTVAGQAVVGVSSRLSRALPLALPPQVDGTDQPLLTLLAQGDARLAGQVQTGGTAAHTWDLLVTSTSRAPVELSWPGLGRALPGSLVLELTDDAGTTLLNTRSAWRWQPAGPGEAKRLRLTARLGHITRSAVTSLGLRGSRGAGQSIALTLAAPADVVVTVRGLGGRLVRELRASCGVGPTALAWDGTDAQGRPVPAGTYRLEAQAIAANGAVDRAVRTVTLP